MNALCYTFSYLTKRLPVLAVWVVLSCSCLSAQNTRKLYERFQIALDACDDCISRRNEHEIGLLKESLKAIEKDLKSAKNGGERDFLMLLIAEQQLLSNTALYEMDKVSLAGLTSIIERVIGLQKSLGSLNMAYAAFEDAKWHDDQLRVLGLQGKKRPDFEKNFWPKIDTQIKSKIGVAEDLIYQKLTPGKTLRELEFFLSRASYEGEDFNRNAMDAFLRYYRGLTFSGCPDDLEAFKNLIERNKNNLKPWQALFKASEFRASIYDRDVKLANQIHISMARERVSEKELQAVIDQAAPWEIALIALQRLVKPYIDNGNFDQALELMETYRQPFTSERAEPFVREKYEGTIEVIRSCSSAGLRLQKVAGLSTPGKNEIRFFQNKDKTRIALEPAQSGKVEVFKQENPGIHTYKFEKSKAIALAGANLYWFEQRDKAKYDQLNEIPKLKYPFSEQVKGHESFDFYIDDHVIFFASYASYERMLAMKNDDPFGEYHSVGFVNEKVLLQEINGTKGYHGRKSGNPNTDIYYMVLGIDNSWSEPKLLKRVNTPFCERSPILSADESMLYFASEGWAGLGGLDVFWAPLQIDREKKMVTLTDGVHNLFDVNSTGDELYYTPLDNEGAALLSSNRQETKNFDIYLVDPNQTEERGGTSDPDTNTVEKPKLEERTILDRHNQLRSKIDFSVQCHWNEQEQKNRNFGPMNGRIRVTGKIFDPQDRLYPHARIVFQEYQTGKPIADSLVVSKNKNQYEVYLLEDTKYYVKVYGYDDAGDLISGFTDEFIEICPSRPVPINLVEKNFKLTAVDSILKNGHSLEHPFFFDFNQHAYSVSDETIIELALKDLQARWGRIPGAKIQLVGFADTIGNTPDNIRLAQKRANYAHNTLIKRGISTMPIIVTHFGETSIFNADADKGKFVGKVLPYGVWQKLKTQDERRRQMNRRTEIIIIGVL